jgi:hypothetical protein
MTRRHEEELEELQEAHQTQNTANEQITARQRADIPAAELELWELLQGQAADEQWRQQEEELRTAVTNHRNERDAMLLNQQVEAAVGDGSEEGGQMSQ